MKVVQAKKKTCFVGQMDIKRKIQVYANYQIVEMVFESADGRPRRDHSVAADGRRRVFLGRNS